VAAAILDVSAAAAAAAINVFVAIATPVTNALWATARMASVAASQCRHLSVTCHHCCCLEAAPRLLLMMSRLLLLLSLLLLLLLLGGRWWWWWWWWWCSHACQAVPQCLPECILVHQEGTHMPTTHQTQLTAWPVRLRHTQHQQQQQQHKR
jgi:hypothetical protein